MKRIAILGAGIAGLSAAYELGKRTDVEATLFDAAPRLGGIIATHRSNGFVIELGPDGWVTEKPWARTLTEELGLADQLIPSLDAQRRTYILQAGRLVPIPDGMRMMVPVDLPAIESSPLFTVEAKQACAEEPTRAEELRASAPTHDESIASFVRRHFGDEMLRKVGAPLLSGVFGGNVETLSVRAVMPQFVAMEREHGSLIAALQSKAAIQTTAPAASIFTSLRSGVASLVEALAARIPPSWLRLNTPVTQLQRTATGWQVNGESFDAILVATPVHVTRKLLTPIDPEAAALLQMETSSAAAVALAFDQPFDLPQGFGFLVPEPGDPRSDSASEPASQLLACTFVDQKYPSRAPAGKRLLRAFFGGAAATRLLLLSDAQLTALAHTELTRILGPLPTPALTVVSRLPNSLPQYAVGHLDRMAQLDLRIAALGNIALLGNAYRGVGLPDLIRDARTAAARIE